MKKKEQDSSSEVSEEGSQEETSPPSKGLSLIDFVLRIVAAVSTLGSTIAIATTGQSLPSFSQFMRFKAHYQDLPTFKFFLVANGMATAYLVLSLALSVFHIFKTGAKVTRTVLIILDTIILALLTAGASAAAAIAYLAHKGNAEANWVPICQQNNSFCERASGSLVGSFMGVLVLMLLIFLSAIAMSRK
ncbi:hypothetical protein ACS0TY_028396 [Phlomoides rotata]